MKLEGPAVLCGQQEAVDTGLSDGVGGAGEGCHWLQLESHWLPGQDTECQRDVMGRGGQGLPGWHGTLSFLSKGHGTQD